MSYPLEISDGLLLAKENDVSKSPGCEALGLRLTARLAAFLAILCMISCKTRKPGSNTSACVSRPEWRRQIHSHRHPCHWRSESPWLPRLRAPGRSYHPVCYTVHSSLHEKASSVCIVSVPTRSTSVQNVATTKIMTSACRSSCTTNLAVLYSLPNRWPSEKFNLWNNCLREKRLSERWMYANSW